MSEPNVIELKQDKEQLKQQAAVKEWLKQKFAVPAAKNEQVNELITGMASLLHAAATMVIKSGSKQQEGGKAIDLLQEALLYYVASQAYERPAPNVQQEEGQISEDLQS
jgi:hypothetical protein